MASEGNQSAFEAIFYRYKDKLYSFIFRFNSSPEITEDIIQEIFLKLWKDKESLRSIEHFSSYLFMMSRNHSINALKRFAKESLILSQINRLKGTSCSNDPEVFLRIKKRRNYCRDLYRHCRRSKNWFIRSAGNMG